MTVTAVFLVPALVCLIGLLLWVIPGVPPKLSDAGKIMFAAGLLVTLFVVARNVIKF